MTRFKAMMYTSLRRKATDLSFMRTGGISNLLGFQTSLLHPCKLSTRSVSALPQVSFLVAKNPSRRWFSSSSDALGLDEVVIYQLRERFLCAPNGISEETISGLDAFPELEEIINAGSPIQPKALLGIERLVDIMIQATAKESEMTASALCLKVAVGVATGRLEDALKGVEGLRECKNVVSVEYLDNLTTNLKMLGSIQDTNEGDIISSTELSKDDFDVILSNDAKLSQFHSEDNEKVGELAKKNPIRAMEYAQLALSYTLLSQNKVDSLETDYDCSHKDDEGDERYFQLARILSILDGCALVDWENAILNMECDNTFEEIVGLCFIQTHKQYIQCLTGITLSSLAKSFHFREQAVSSEGLFRSSLMQLTTLQKDETSYLKNVIGPCISKTVEDYAKLLKAWDNREVDAARLLKDHPEADGSKDVRKASLAKILSPKVQCLWIRNL